MIFTGTFLLKKIKTKKIFFSVFREKIASGSGLPGAKKAATAAAQPHQELSTHWPYFRED